MLQLLARRSLTAALLQVQTQGSNSTRATAGESRGKTHLGEEEAWVKVYGAAPGKQPMDGLIEDSYNTKDKA